MDEIKNNGANLFRNSEKTTTETGGFISETFFNTECTRNTGKLKLISAHDKFFA